MTIASPGRARVNLMKYLLPLCVFAAAIGAWEIAVRLKGIPPYILPAPSLIAKTLVADWPLLRASLVTTLETTLGGLALALVGGVGLAVLLSLSRIVEYSLYPFAVVLQVTPVIAIAPLLLIYMPQDVAVLACAWLVAFFPVLSNTMLGLQSVDRNLMELFRLYGAPTSRTPLARFRARLKALWYLRRPAALPAFLAGLRIAGGLSLIGAVVAEMAAGSAGAGSGLAYRIIESQYRLNIPRLFAALVLLALTGIGLYLLLAALSHLLLRRWHESALAGGE
ncbi:NitT/TauT family transport system permease protein [Microvirga flocculans]|uniref:NitT/TauT family transport system permease protein n=1 Tax=Microvirga flocculans TaxID=217168 RepID=A0A7W6IGE2_9HYPH|nr:ABC transporter permease [Microvirga flocculans]MBB4041017.1 NitT/TauT family transport system permease protein [Microvirga flocculans]